MKQAKITAVDRQRRIPMLKKITMKNKPATAKNGAVFTIVGYFAAEKTFSRKGLINVFLARIFFILN